MSRKSTTNEIVEWLKTNGYNVYTGIWDKYSLGRVLFEATGGHVNDSGKLVVSASLYYISEKHDIGSIVQSIAKIINILRAFEKEKISFGLIEISNTFAYAVESKPHSEITIRIEYTEVPPDE